MSERYMMTALPGTSPGLWVPRCVLCGVLVLDMNLHTSWHDGETS